MSIKGINVKSFTVTLNPELIAEAKLYYTSDGGKLSSLINALLSKWVEKKREIMKKENPQVNPVPVVTSPKIEKPTLKEIVKDTLSSVDIDSSSIGGLD